MNKKLSGVFTVILMINVLTFNIYAMEHLIDRDDREYSEILSLNDEILDSLNHGLAHSETGKDISEDELKMEQAFKVYADIPVFRRSTRKVPSFSSRHFFISFPASRFFLYLQQIFNALLGLFLLKKFF